MNNIAVFPQIVMHGLQIQNVKRDVAKKVSMDDLEVHESSTDIELLVPEVEEKPTKPDYPVSENVGLMAANEVGQTSFI